MENATKALLIAAAILIAIVVITLGVFVLGKGSTLVKENSDMSDVEISTYNSKFEAYFGTNVRGAQVKQLISAVNQHNQANAGDASKVITLSGAGGLTLTSTSETEKIYPTSGIQTGKAYKVDVTKSSDGKTTGYTTGGLISGITIEQKK